MADRREPGRGRPPEPKKGSGRWWASEDHPVEGVPAERYRGRQYHVPAPESPDDRRKRTAAPTPASPPVRERQPQPRHQPSPKHPTTRSQRPRRRRSKLGRIALTLLVVVGLATGFIFIRAWTVFNRIERVDLEGALSPATGDFVNYLLVGSDSRDELDPEGSSGVTGRRADTIIVLRIDSSGSKMMSIPRDLWVEIADTGQNGRINGAYNRGAPNLVRTVTQNLDIPINHYMEVGFASFSGLVDALGGVPIEFDYPAFDHSSGLNIGEPGLHVLNGTQALAYARSRHMVEIVDGVERRDPTGDLGRQDRQQKFLRSALGELGATRNPLQLLAAGDAMSSELKVDNTLGLFDMFRLARKLGAASPESVILPTRPARKGQAAVLVLREDEAMGVLAGFR